MRGVSSRAIAPAPRIHCRLLLSHAVVFEPADDADKGEQKQPEQNAREEDPSDQRHEGHRSEQRTNGDDCAQGSHGVPPTIAWSIDMTRWCSPKAAGRIVGPP